MLLLISMFSVVTAETFGYGRTEDIPINYSLIPTVNNSLYFNGYSISTLYTYYKSLFDTAYDLVYAPITEPLSLHLNGDNSPTGDIDWGGNDITNAGNLNVTGNVTASSFIGDGSQLTGTMNYTNVALTNQTNNFYAGAGQMKIGHFQNKYNPFDTKGRALDVSSYHSPKSPSTSLYEGIGGFNVIGGGNYSDGSKATALAFGNVALTEAYQGLGAGGNESLDVYGLNIYGADGISHWASGVDGIFSMRDVYGMDLISARKQSRVYGNIYNTMLRASTTTEAVDGNETILTLEKPTKGVNNWQMILEGTGTGTGIWFGGTGGERIYSDGTNLNFDTNGNLAYFSNNISATGFITRTSLLSADTIAQDWIKDTEDYKNEDGSIKHSAFKGYTEFQVTDFNKSEINQWKEEQCLTIPIINEEYCKIVDMEEITYPYTKIEKGVDLQTEQNVLRQGLYEALERIKYLEDNCQMKLVTK